MTFKKVFLSILFGILLVGCSVQNNKTDTSNQLPKPSETNQKSDIIASFTIFTNGTRRDFSDKKYHNLNSDVFIETQKPTTIIVKTEGKTWQDFFNTLPMKVTQDCLTTGTGQQFCNTITHTLKFYLNGLYEESILSEPISDGDKLLISYGVEKNGDNKLVQQILQVPNP